MPPAFFNEGSVPRSRHEQHGRSQFNDRGRHSNRMSSYVSRFPSLLIRRIDGLVSDTGNMLRRIIGEDVTLTLLK